jgi:hypothetical protein
MTSPETSLKHAVRKWTSPASGNRLFPAASEITLTGAITRRPRRGTLEPLFTDQGAWEAGPVPAQTYEITFLGQAGSPLRTEFEDCEITVGPGTTTLRAELPDRGALSGLIQRISSLGLDVIDVSLVAPPAGQ